MAKRPQRVTVRIHLTGYDEESNEAEGVNSHNRLSRLTKELKDALFAHNFDDGGKITFVIHPLAPEQGNPER